MIIGDPASSTNCLGRSPPSRVPFPAATIIATFMRLAFGVGNSRQGRSGPHFPQCTPRALAVDVAVLAELAKDHFAGGRLQHAGHRYLRVFTYQAARVVDNDHRAVIEVSNSLVVF